MTRGWFFCDEPPIVTGAKKQSSPPAAHLVVRASGEIVCGIPNLTIAEMGHVPRGYVLACARCLEISEAAL